MAKRGRPSKYTPEIADEILSRMAEGESLRSICSANGMPAFPTVSMWAINDQPEGFSERYAQAQRIGWMKRADQLIPISEGEGEDDDSVKVARDRLRIDTLKWTLARMLPNDYGEKTTADVNLNQTGTVEVKVVREFVEPKPTNRITEHMTNGNGNGAHP